MQQSHTFASPTSQHTSQSLQKSVPAQRTKTQQNMDRTATTNRRPACNSGLAKEQGKRTKANTSLAPSPIPHRYSHFKST